jgi:predicted protein tyrosine phosphatase
MIFRRRGLVLEIIGFHRDFDRTRRFGVHVWSGTSCAADIAAGKAMLVQLFRAEQGCGN